MIIYSYIDTLLEKWIEWSEGFLSQKLTLSTNKLNDILGGNTSDNSTRSNEFYRIGLLNFELTKSTHAYDSLRNSEPIQSKLGYIAYVIAKAKKKDPNNSIVNLGFNALCSICLIQQCIEFKNCNISYNSILYFLIEKFPLPAGCDEKSYLRYLSAGMFCELNDDKEIIYNAINSNTVPVLRIIDEKTQAIRATFNSSNDIKKAIDNNVSLTHILYQKGSIFFIGNHNNPNPRGLFYLSYSNFNRFLKEVYEIEIQDLKKNPFDKIFDTVQNQNKIADIKSIFIKNNKSKNLIELMKTLEEGSLEAIKILGWTKVSTVNLDIKNVIFYGSPGTGKSHKADEITNGKEVQKVTFHPDYDYHSFVGGYKPTMDGDKIAYKFVPQIFTKIYIDAWKNLILDEVTKPFYLQIEEINRGNCADIFGDLFQLLDRDKNGFSKYEVTAEEELCRYLLSADGFGGEHPGIENGKIRFPSNLKIIATMNTSDQSLFPMDSAFKRRWDWIYVPIDYNCSSSDFTIQLNNCKSFQWLSFLKIINEEIFEITKSQDKQIGNWFIDAQNTGKVISESTFVNKVIFYLWNDVFKDEENTIFKSAEGKNLTYTSFFEDGDSNNLVSYILEERLKLINVSKSETTTTAEE